MRVYQKYVNHLALIPEQSFLKNRRREWRGRGEECRRARGRSAAPVGSRWMGSSTKHMKKRAAREAPRFGPVGSPCLVPHMAFLPRREGGEAAVLLNKSSKRAKRGRVVHNLKFNRFLWPVTPVTQALHAPCSVSCVFFGNKRQLQHNVSRPSFIYLFIF